VAKVTAGAASVHRDSCRSREEWLAMLMRTDPFRSGVLTLRIPVAAQAKPRKIAITNAGSGQKQIHA
jgi:hypothetical protein